MKLRSGDVAAVGLSGITKRFAGFAALSGADLEAHRGEIHAVLGENGAGKTTLMNVLAGVLRPDDGQVAVFGLQHQLKTPRDATRAGIGMVHQHFTLVPAFTGLENVALGAGAAWRRRGLAPDFPAHLKRLSEQTGLDVPLDRAVSELGVGERQRLEILKVLFRQPRVLILDEPTAVLAPPEVTRLFSVLRGLADAGTALLLVAHKLDEVMAIADRATVLRHGRTVLEVPIAEARPASLARAMVGGDEALTSPRTPEPRLDLGTTPAAVARLQGVHVSRDGVPVLRGVDLTIGRGEIVGIAGVAGNGQRELALVLSGILEPSWGEVEVPRTVGLVPQDRGREGLIPGFSIEHNLLLAFHDDRAYRRGPFIDRPRVERTADELVREFDVRTSGTRALVHSLSGGNQQKVVVGREMLRGGDLLVVENPTRGLDIQSTAFVRSRLTSMVRESGRSPPGIVVISTDLDEVLEISDRVYVLVRGHLSAVPEGLRTRAGVGRLMLEGPNGPAPE